jgi:hypothetical protein
MRERLLSAARLNAITEIEGTLRELREREPGTQALVDHLESLLSRYDTDSVVDLLKDVDSTP